MDQYPASTYHIPPAFHHEHLDNYKEIQKLLIQAVAGEHWAGTGVLVFVFVYNCIIICMYFFLICTYLCLYLYIFVS